MEGRRTQGKEGGGVKEKRNIMEGDKKELNGDDEYKEDEDNKLRKSNDDPISIILTSTSSGEYNDNEDQILRVTLNDFDESGMLSPQGDPHITADGSDYSDDYLNVEFHHPEYGYILPISEVVSDNITDHQEENDWPLENSKENFLASIPGEVFHDIIEQQLGNDFISNDHAVANLHLEYDQEEYCVFESFLNEVFNNIINHLAENEYFIPIPEVSGLNTEGHEEEYEYWIMMSDANFIAIPENEETD